MTLKPLAAAGPDLAMHRLHDESHDGATRRIRIAVSLNMRWPPQNGSLFPIQPRAGLIFSHLGLEEIFLLANVCLLVEPWQPAFLARVLRRLIDLARTAVVDLAELL